MHRVRIALALSALLTLAVASHASAAFTVRTNGDGWISRIGELRTRGGKPPTFERASAVFGRPTEVEQIGESFEACRIAWGDLGLRTTFVNFGGGRACAPAEGLLQIATIRSRRFRTVRDLRVGDRSSTIPEKHPKARFKGKTWWITSAISPFGEEATEIPTIEAIVQAGRVKVLRLWVGSAGD